jgi:hypothetical protein
MYFSTQNASLEFFRGKNVLTSAHLRFKMAASLASSSEEFCSECKQATKYKCLNCSVAVCNECSTFEEDEDVPRWQMGKAVGYCENCYLVKGSDNENKSLEDTESSFSKSTEDKGKYLIFLYD